MGDSNGVSAPPMSAAEMDLAFCAEEIAAALERFREAAEKLGARSNSRADDLADAAVIRVQGEVSTVFALMYLLGWDGES